MRSIGLSGNRLSIAVLLIILLAVTYFNALNNPFHFDDFHHIRDNPAIKDIRNIASFFTNVSAFSGESVTGHYRPLLMASHAINFYLGGYNPVGYHLVNLAFHAGAAFMIFLIIQAILGKAGGSSEQVAPPTFFIALASALIFAVNPFNSEVVNYISTRSSVMSAFFYLLAFYCWVKYRGVGTDVRSGLPAYLYLISLIAFLLGLLTKEIVITLPVILWLYDLYFVPGAKGVGKLDLGARLKRLAVYLPFLLLVAFPYLLLRAYLSGVMVSPAKPPRSYYVNLLTQTNVLVKYIRLQFIPVGQSVEHYIAESYSLLDWRVILSVLVLLTIVGIGIWLYNRSAVSLRLVSFFIFWFFIVMLPTTLIPLEVIMQENRGYLAAAGPAVVLGVVLGGISSAKFSGRWLAPLLLAILLLAYSGGTMYRNTFWQDDITLWSDAVRKGPLLARAHHNIAVSYRERGYPGGAIVEYRKAIELNPARKESHYALGNIYRSMKLYGLAVYEYNMAIEIDPDYFRARNNLGLTYWKMGELNAAIEQFGKAIAINSAYVLPHLNLGRVYAELGETDKAYREFEMAREKASSIPGEEKNVEIAMKYMERLKMQENP